MSRIRLVAALALLTGCIPVDEVPDTPPPGRAELVASFGATSLGQIDLTERDTEGESCRLDITTVMTPGRFRKRVDAAEAETAHDVEFAFLEKDLDTAAVGDTLFVNARGTGCGRALGDGGVRFYVTSFEGDVLAGVFTGDLNALCGPTGCTAGSRFYRILGGVRFDTTTTVQPF